MRNPAVTRSLCLVVSVVLLLTAGTALAGRDCDANGEAMLLDREMWEEIYSKVEATVAEHSEENAKILVLQASALEQVTAAVKATTNGERRQAIDEFKIIDQQVEDRVPVQPERDYVDHWEKLQKDYESLKTRLFEFHEDCPVEVRGEPKGGFED